MNLNKITKIDSNAKNSPPNIESYSNILNIDNKDIKISYPIPEKDDTKNLSLKEQLISTIYKCTSISYSIVGLCDLSGNIYKDEKKKEMKSFRLRSASKINFHYLYGLLNYHPDYEYRIPYANTIFENMKGIISFHNLQNQKIKIMRSNFDINEVNIEKDTPLKINGENELTINVMLKKNLFKKCWFSDKNINGSNISGILSLNKDIFTSDFLLKIGFQKFEEEWINSIQNEWKNKIINCLKKENINYEFYELQ